MQKTNPRFRHFELLQFNQCARLTFCTNSLMGCVSTSMQTGFCDLHGDFHMTVKSLMSSLLDVLYI